MNALRALVIAATDFGGKYERLPYAAISAREIARLLARRHRMQVTAAIDAPWAESDFREADLIYVAGHGEAREAIVGERHLTLAEIERPERLAILDCCRCGATLTPPSPVRKGHYSLMPCLFFCASRWSVFNLPGEGSLFGTALVQALVARHEGDFLDREGLSYWAVEHVKQIMREWTAQNAASPAQAPVVGVLPLTERKTEGGGR